MFKKSIECALIGCQKTNILPQKAVYLRFEKNIDCKISEREEKYSMEVDSGRDSSGIQCLSLH